MASVKPPYYAVLLEIVIIFSFLILNVRDVVIHADI